MQELFGGMREVKVCGCAESKFLWIGLALAGRVDNCPDSRNVVQMELAFPPPAAATAF